MAEDVLHVQIWPDDLDGGFVVQCIELPGCISQGDTEDEALANISDAISEMLQVIIRENARPEPDPEPGEVRSIRVAVGA